jgi:hypothetical protein
MKTIVAVFIITAASLLGPVSKSSAQTVRDDDSGGQGYFLHAVSQYCGPRAQVRMSASSASIYLAGEYLQDRNLEAVARNLAIEGLNAFPDSGHFYVYIHDSRGEGSANVNR